MDLTAAHAELLAAAAGETSFVSAIGAITRDFGAGGGIIFEMNRRTLEIGEVATPNLVIGDDGYDAHLNAINPRMKYSLRHAPRHVAHEALFISERAMDRHEFYDWLSRYAGFRYFLGSRVWDDGDMSLFHSIEFSTRHGQPDEAKIAAFRRLAPSLGNAWRLKSRRAPGRDPADARAWTPNHLPWSIFALDSKGAVVSMNDEACALIRAGGSLAIVLDTLRAVERDSGLWLRNAIGSALAGHSAETLVACETSRVPLVVQIVPVNTSQATSAPPVAAVAYVWNPLARARDIGPALESLYGFTPAEQELAKRLAAGADLASASDDLKLSRNTVRNRLQSMYAKTGTRRQSELMVRIASLFGRAQSARS